MAMMKWDQVGEKAYESGTDRGVLFPAAEDGKSFGAGIPWSGLTKVAESPDGGEETILWADNVKYASLLSTENFKGSITAYQSPEEFDVSDGSVELEKGLTVTQQTRVPFGLSYRTLIGNDAKGLKAGYKIHLVYNAKVSPSSREHNTINDTPAAVELSWDFTTTPVDVPGADQSAHLIIDSTKVTPEQLTQVEALIYGSEEGTANTKMPLPQDIIDILKPAAGGQ